VGNHVCKIVCVRSPAKILNVVIHRVTIVMAALHPGRTWPNKGLKNESVNPQIVGASILSQSDQLAHVSGAYLLSPPAHEAIIDICSRTLSWIYGAHTTVARNLIVRELRDYFPLFFHGHNSNKWRGRNL
jgi:hypothetical protein